MTSLTPRQARFVEEYLIDCNAAGAARRAGYAASSARTHVSRILRQPAVAAALKARMEERSASLGLRADRVLEEFVRIAFADPVKLAARLEAGGTLAEVDEALGAAVSGIDMVVKAGETRIKVSMCDKLKVLPKLAAHVGLAALADRPQAAMLAAAEEADEERTAPRWEPLPGPQMLAFESCADIVGYGGAAGGGKTDLALGLALRRHRTSAIFRREATQLTGIVERLAEIVGGRKGYNSQARLWRLDGRRQIAFGSAPHAGDEVRYQGRPKDLLVLDEAQNFLESQARFLMGWVRTATPGQKCTTLMTFNPPTSAEGRWVTSFFAPWLDDGHANPAKDGELRWFATIAGKDVEVDDARPFMLEGEARVYAFDPAGVDAGRVIRPISRTFIRSRAADNPHLARTGYLATLQAMPEPLRSQMLEGDFSAGVEDDRWQVIPSAWVDAAMARWTSGSGRSAMDSLGVDVARGGRDKTIIARRHGDWIDSLICLEGGETPDGPTLAGQVMAHRRDRAVAHIDVVGWGASPYDFLRANDIQVVAVNGAARAGGRTREAGIAFANMRAQLWWRAREALDPAGPTPIALPPDAALKAELCAPRWRQTLSGVQIEAKDEVAARIGRSPDRGDAVCLALMTTPKTGAARPQRSTPGGSWMG